MFPKMNPRQMKKMMRQMGMEMKELSAREVVIKLEDRTITIKNPDVNLIEVQGQKTYQIAGGEETTGTGDGGVQDEDIEVVAAQAGVSKEKAKEALEKADGDLAAAILSLQNS